MNAPFQCPQPLPFRSFSHRFEFDNVRIFVETTQKLVNKLSPFRSTRCASHRIHFRFLSEPSFAVDGDQSGVAIKLKTISLSVIRMTVSFIMYPLWFALLVCTCERVLTSTDSDDWIGDDEPFVICEEKPETCTKKFVGVFWNGTCDPAGDSIALIEEDALKLQLQKEADSGIWKESEVSHTWNKDSFSVCDLHQNESYDIQTGFFVKESLFELPDLATFTFEVSSQFWVFKFVMRAQGSAGVQIQSQTHDEENDQDILKTEHEMSFKAVKTDGFDFAFCFTPNQVTFIQQNGENFFLILFILINFFFLILGHNVKVILEFEMVLLITDFTVKFSLKANPEIKFDKSKEQVNCTVTINDVLVD